jgi:hypothetical protein
MTLNRMVGSDATRRYKAQYTSGMGAEIRKNVRLEVAEQIVETRLVHGRIN